MNKTKRGLLLAGSIIGIVEAVMCVFLGFSVLAFRGVVDIAFIEEVLVEIEEVSYTSSDLNELLKLSKIACTVISILLFMYSIALGVISILLLKRTKRGVFAKGLTITMLVLSALISDMLILAFMIASLLIKDEKPTLENIKEIGENHNIGHMNIEDKEE